MIKEVLVVEGKMDVVAIDKAVEADCIITEGFNLKPQALDSIAKAYQKRGIIIMTDPDSAGERIRRFLTKRFPEAKHAFIPKEDATANNDIGIEQASPEAIRTALASEKRAKLGAVLGIGYANAKTFLQRLNHYGITRQEFQQAVAELEK